MSSTAMSSRRMLLVPLPLALQHILKFTSDHLPTVTLLGFLLIQFVLNILRYIPAKYWQNWVDRTRFVLKALLDRDYRHEMYQLELLRQRLAESERRGSAAQQDLEVSQENCRTLRERLVKHTSECEAHSERDRNELSRLNRQLDSQGKLLVETEALLEALRAGDSTRLSKLGNEDRAVFTSKIKLLEDQVGSLTKERNAVNEDAKTLKAERQAAQDQCNKATHTNAQLQAEKDELTKRLHAVEAMERRVTESRDEALNRLNEALQHATATQTSFEQQRDEMNRLLKEAVASRDAAQHLLQTQDQGLASATSGSGDVSDQTAELQNRLKTLEESNAASKKVADEAQAVHSRAIEKAEAKIAQLETALSEKIHMNNELTKQVNGKDEEIERLIDAIEHGDGRPHKLRKPRHSMPTTPPATTASHPRSGSISSRFGSYRERTLSSASKPSNSPTTSPAHRANLSLPSDAIVPTISGPSNSNSGGHEDTTLADTSITSSTNLNPPSLGKSSRRPSVSRKRLSSILGIHIGGDKDKDKSEKEKEKHHHHQ